MVVSLLSSDPGASSDTNHRRGREGKAERKLCQDLVLFLLRAIDGKPSVNAIDTSAAITTIHGIVMYSNNRRLMFCFNKSSEE